MPHQPARDPNPESSARALEVAGRPEEALHAWQALGRKRAVGPARALAFVEEGRLLAALGRNDEATHAYRRALSNDPQALPALAALGEIALRERDWVRLADIGRLRFASETNPIQRAHVALAAGRLEIEHLNCPEAARRWILDGLDCAPEAPELLEVLVELERARADDSALRAALERLIAARGATPSPLELLEAASLQAKRGEYPAALARLEQASALAPDDPRVLEALTAVLSRLDNPADLADVLERRAVLSAADPQLASSVLSELGALLEERLFDFEGAHEAYTRALHANPQAVTAQEAAARLSAKLDADPSAFEAPAAPSTTGQGPFERALLDLELEARSTSDRTRLGLLVREIESLVTRQGTPERALPWVQRWAAGAPEDPEALRALARLHDRPGSESELIASLEALDPLLPIAERAVNRRRIASLLRERGLVDEAARAWQTALELEPRDSEALDALATHYREQGDSVPLLDTLMRQVALCSPQGRPNLLAEIAALQRRAEDFSGELATLQQLEHEDGAPAGLADRIDALLEGAGRFDELVERWERRCARAAPDDPLVSMLSLRRAELLRGPLGRPEAAATAYREILEHQPGSEEARLGLERALRDSFDAEGLAEVLAGQVESARDPAARDRAALERATLLEEVLERVDDATEVYRGLAAHSSETEVRFEASERYERLLERGQHWPALRTLWESQLDEGSDAQRAERHERLARLCADRLGDASAELSHLEAITALDPTRADVWKKLSDRYEAEGRQSQAVDAMEREIAAGCEVRRARTLHARLADTYRKLADDARACSHYEQLFELDPCDVAAAHHLIARYEADGRSEELLRLLEMRLAALRGSDENAPRDTLAGDTSALRVHIAAVRVELGDIEGAISALEVALGEVGPIAQIAEPLAVCYQRAGYALDLIELCRSAATHHREPGEAANWWVRLGDAFLSRDRPREAVDAYHQALTERPGDRAVQASLRAIYRRLGRPAPLAGLLDAELEHLAGQDEIPVRMELARLSDRDLERPEAALLHAKRVLQLAPLHPTAFPLALELTDRLERPDLALELLDARIARTRDARLEADLHARRARLLARSPERRDEAVAAFRAALALAPDCALRTELAEALEAAGRWQELVLLLGDQSRAAAPEEQAGWLERAAAIAAERLGNEASLPWLTRLRALRPDDLGLVRRIAGVHGACGQIEAQLRALSHGLALAETPRQLRDLQLERAALLELELASPSRAVNVLDAARRALPNDPEILGNLERLQRRLGRDAERAATLAALIDVTPEDAGELHAELAALYSGPLGDPTAAIPHWLAALERTTGTQARIAHMRALAEAQLAAGDRAGWARTAEAELAALDPAPVFDDRRRSLRRELAFAYDGPLARPVPALRHACAMLDAGEHELIIPEVLGRLEELVLRRLRESDAPVELEARLVRHLSRHPDEAKLWLELARLREERLHATGAGIEAYRRVLELDANCLDALRGLRGAAERLERWPDVVDALDRDLHHPETTDPQARAALLRRLGDVHWHRLHSTTRASRCYAAALESDGADYAALRALERLLESMEDWRGALDLYESEVEVLGSDDPARRHEIWLHVAALAGDHLDDVNRARRALERAAEITPLAARELAELAQLHERAGDTAALAEVLTDWCNHPDVQSGPDDLLRLAHHLEGLGRLDDALASVESALDFDPPLPDAWDAAARLREQIGDAHGAALALASAADRTAGPDAAGRLLRAARLIEASDGPAALELLRRAARVDPASVEVQAARARLALGHGCLEEAEAAAATTLDLGTHACLPTPSALEVALIGGDAARARDRLSEAAAFYARARDLDPEDPRANGRYGESLMALDDPGRARAALEARLQRGDDYPERARHRALLARCLEANGELEGALATIDDALAEAPWHDDALATSVRLRESLGRIDECVAALEVWARHADGPQLRAERLLRAAEVELTAGRRADAAESHLRAALAANPDLMRAWAMLAEHLLGSERAREAIETTDRAAGFADDDPDLAALALLQGRAYEALGERTHAAAAFGMAAEADPRCTTAALTQARLLRGAGEWRPAADALEDFLSNHPDRDDASLADVHEQLGRLLAGPLEDVNAATLNYRRAIALDPLRLPSRAALAELLSHRPGDRQEAIEQLRLLLAANPTDAVCLRVALRIARANPDGAGVATGIAVLRGLGLASAYEHDEPHAAPPPPTPTLRNRHFEQLRCIAQEACEGIAQALEASESPTPFEADGPEARFRAAMLACEGRLTAPALLPRTTREIAEILSMVVRLAVDPDSLHGDGRQVNALAASLRRRERRRLRRWVGETPVQELCGVDFEAWRTEVRALAAASVIGEGGHDLRIALVALLRESNASLDANLRESADLAPLVAACPIAFGLLRRIVCEWVDRI